MGVGLAQELRFLLGVDLLIEAAVRQIISLLPANTGVKIVSAAAGNSTTATRRFYARLCVLGSSGVISRRD